jgi:hypothetical protein
LNGTAVVNVEKPTAACAEDPVRTSRFDTVAGSIVRCADVYPWREHGQSDMLRGSECLFCVD